MKSMFDNLAEKLLPMLSTPELQNLQKLVVLQIDMREQHETELRKWDKTVLQSGHIGGIDANDALRHKWQKERREQEKE